MASTFCNIVPLTLRVDWFPVDNTQPDARLQVVVTDRRGLWTQCHKIIQVMTKEINPTVMSQYPFHHVCNGGKDIWSQA